MAVTAYRDMGYLPEAVLNYLVRLGWSYGDQEFFQIGELIEKFSLENIGKSAGIFDQEKLQALNADHIQAMAPARLYPHLKPFLEKAGYDPGPGACIETIIVTLNQRSKTLEEMAAAAGFYFADEIEYEEKAAKKFLKAGALEPVHLLADKLAALELFSEKALEDVFRAVMEETGLKLGKIAQPVRVALTGRTASPGIFEIIEILGREKVLKRLAKAIEFMKT